MPNWVKVAQSDDIPDSDDAFVVAVEGDPVAIFKVDGDMFAIEDRCPHQRTARLSDGYLDGHVIECPLHQACFDIRSGKVLSPPANEDIRTYPVKEEEGAVFLYFTRG